MSDHAYWFPAKRYGWGWGFPRVWQGQLTLAAYVALMIGATVLFPPETAGWPYFVSVGVLTAALIGICLRKGEPARWRRGH